MKTTYWLVTAAAVAAAGVTVYARLTAGDPQVPQVPAVTEAPREVPQLALPPVVMPPDEPLAMSMVPDTPAAPMPLPEMKSTGPAVPVPTMSALPAPLGPVIPASAMVPVLPPLPAIPQGEPPFEPLVVPPLPKPPVPPKPELPPPSVTPLVNPAVPPAASVVPPAPPTPLPLGPTSVLQPPVPAKPQPLPAPTPVDDAGSREPLAVVGKFVVLKDDKLLEGAVTVSKDVVIVRQGALDRPFHKSHVQFVAADRDEVYHFMLAKVPANDAAARLKVAQWCMFSGLREQALTEAREVRKLQPNNSAAADMVRSLELSLQQNPIEAVAKMTAPTAPTFPAELAPAPTRPIPPAAVVDPEPDVTPEAALVFGARVQPFLANQCVGCHAKPDHAGAFKLVRVTPTDAGPQATRANLRAVAGQLRKDDPGASPLLLKTLSAHGGMKLPAVDNRQAAAYVGLEWWTALAVGTPITAPPAVVPAAPVPPVSPVSPVPPTSPTLVPPVADPVLPLPNPPVVVPPTPSVLPVPPAADPVPVPFPPVGPASVPLLPPPVADPLLPPPLPVTPAPAPQPKPVVPAISPADTFPPIPSPALPPTAKPVPVSPPFIPPADLGVKPTPVPPIPPATAAPKPPSPVVPVGGTQFGAAIPPKPPVTGPSGDEFDPAGFNLQPRK